MEEIAQLLWRASEGRRECRITMEGEPIVRLVHPYGICRTQANRIVLVCWQAMGFTKAGGKAGYRNLLLQSIKQVEILNTCFAMQPGFHPADGQYKEWVYHV
jgi:hypothetical protein